MFKKIFLLFLFSFFILPLQADAGYEYSLKWGSSGSGNGQFNRPTSVAIDSSGNVYIGEGEADRIQKFDSSGNYITKWGSAGTGNGQFGIVRGMAFDQAGDLYVVDDGNDRIQKFSSSGVYISQFGTSGSGNGQFTSPYGIAIDSAGNIYVSDSGLNRVQKFNSSGTYISQFVTSGSGEEDLTNGISRIYFDSADNLYLINYTTIKKYDSSGDFISNYDDGSMGAVNDMFIDPEGNLLLTADNSVRLYSSSSEALMYEFGSLGSGNGQFHSSWALALSDSGELYVTDYFNNRVQKFIEIPTPPTVATSGDSDITNNSVTLEGSIDVLGDSLPSEHGFAYGVSTDLSTVISTTTLGSKTSPGNFTSDLSGLTGNTTYYFRAYATNTSGTGFGIIDSFTTEEVSVQYSGNFTEAHADNGTLAGSRVMSLTYDTFVNAGGTLTLNTHYTLTNMPAGLTPVMTVNGGGTTATLTFTGSATNPTPTEDVDNLTVTFLDGAFTTTADASDVLNYTNSLGEISFVEHLFEGTQTLYGVDGSGENGDPASLFIIEPNSGEKISTIGPVGFKITGLAFHPTTKVLYGSIGGNGASARGLVTISTTTGAGTLLGIIKDIGNTARVMNDIDFRPDGRLYGWSNSTNDLYTIDFENCASNVCTATEVADSGLSGTYGNGLAFDSEDNLYLFGKADDYFYKFDPDTGLSLDEIDFSNPSGEFYPIAAASFDGDDALFASRLNYGGVPTDLIRIDPVTGLITSGGETTDMQYMDAIAFLLEPAVEEETPEETNSSSGSRRHTIPTATVSTFSLPLPPNATREQTITYLTSKIQELLIEYTKLKAAEGGGDNTLKNFQFTTTFGTGTISPEVRSLQHFLNTHGFSVSQTGPGSLNQEINNFGNLTKQALQRYQTSVGIEATGYFGVLTKAKINSILLSE